MLKKYILLQFFLLVAIGVLSAQKLVLSEESEITFRAKHLGLFNVEGEFKEFGGELSMVGDTISGEGYAEVMSIDSGNKTRDKNLKSEDFLDAATYPQVNFSVDRFLINDIDAEIPITMRIRDVEKVVYLPYELTKTGNGLLIETKTVIERADFNLYFDSLDGLVSDEIEIRGYLLFKYP